MNPETFLKKVPALAAIAAIIVLLGDLDLDFYDVSDGVASLAQFGFITLTAAIVYVISSVLLGFVNISIKK